MFNDRTKASAALGGFAEVDNITGNNLLGFIHRLTNADFYLAGTIKSTTPQQAIALGKALNCQIGMINNRYNDEPFLSANSG